MIGKTISHYKIIEKLGGGGMGVVYKAQDVKLDRFVALKFLPPSFSHNDEAKLRFIHEAKSVSALQHNNICAVHEIDETEDLPDVAGGQLFICMDLYEGQTLEKVIKEGPISIDKAIDITFQIADGLEKAHRKGIIHRDIKPANIFITEEGVVKILDFGLAKANDQTQLTQMGSTVGTSSYMSPEQSRGSNVDHRTDIWALGVLLYEMITGEKPFKGDYEQAIIYSIINEAPTAISAYRNDTPNQLIEIVDKSLKKDLNERYQNIEQFILDVEKSFGNYRLRGRSHTGLATYSPLKRKVIYYIAPIIVIITAIIYFISISTAVAKPVSIALLPLRNISSENSQDWFTEGMTDALITDLAKIGGIRIISRSSVMKYKNSDKPTKEIAAELGVLYLIDGSIVKQLDRIRITTRLIDASTDEYIWGQDYERDYSDILSLQGDVAQEIANQIRVKLSPEEIELFSEKKKIDPAAYEAYLKGNFNLYKLSKEGFETALRYFELAAEIEPEYAPAYAGITLAWRSQAQMGFLPFNIAVQKSESAAVKALELDSNLAEIHFMKAVNYTWGEWKWDLANAEFKKAIQLNPNFSEARAYYSQMLFITDHPDNAMKQIEIALELDPFNKLFDALYAMDLMYVRRYNDVINRLEEVLKTAPNEYIALSTLRSAYHQTKNYTKALEMWTRSFEVRKDLESIEALKEGNEEGGYSLALQRVAELFIERTEKGLYVPAWQIATLYTRAGKKKEALLYFEKAFEANDPNLPYLKVDPIFEILYNEPKFKQLLKKMEL